MENILFMGTEYQLNFLMDYAHLITGLRDPKITLCSTKKEFNDPEFYMSDYFAGKSFEALVAKYTRGELEIPSRVYYTGDLRVHDSTWDLSTFVDTQVNKHFKALGLPEENIVKIDLNFRRAKDREKYLAEYTKVLLDLEKIKSYR